MNGIKNVNIAIAFLLELFAIVTLSYWDFTLTSIKILRITISLLTPMSMIMIWSILCAPSSNYRLKGLWFATLKMLLLGIAVCCLFIIK